MEVSANQDDYAVRLKLNSDQELLLQGIDGFSQKHPNGGGSHYYSQPFLKANGELVVDGHRIEVSGQAWLDREWSSQFLQPDQQGWDWFALHLDSGEKLMLFQLRSLQQGDGATGAFHHGALISPDGSKQSLKPELIELTVTRQEIIAGRRLPLEWQINLPEIGRSMAVEALHSDQWMEVDFPYWEGVVTVSGNDPGSSGIGYLELTGYTKQP
jgi:predicted secreted hydrolase